MRDFPYISESVLHEGECPYGPGDLIESSGIYAICHSDSSRQSLVLIRGNRFPPCDCCGAGVRYRLVRAAPYIFDDQDFSPSA